MEPITPPSGRRGGPQPGSGRKKQSRNRQTNDIKILAKTYGPDAIDTLAAIMMNDRIQPAPRVAAARELLDRGFGRPTQFIAGDLEQPPVLMETRQKIDWDKIPVNVLEALREAIASGDDRDEER